MHPGQLKMTGVTRVAQPTVVICVALLLGGCAGGPGASSTGGWSIQGHDFTPYGLIPYDPAFADEIEASIHGYLEEVAS